MEDTNLSVYILSKNGINSVTYISILEIIKNKFKLPSIEGANNLVSRLSIIDLGKISIKFRSGDGLGWGRKVFYLDKDIESHCENYYLLSPYFFRDHILPHRLIIDSLNEKAV